MELIGAKPERRILAYFGIVILIGSFLLSLPFAEGAKEISLIDAFFTSTSAVCVTGLTVVDTGADFSFSGQIIILLLIQFGGIGIMTLASSMLLSFLPQLPFKDRLLISQTLGGEQIKAGSLIKAVMITTFSFEALGAILLFVKFNSQFPLGKAVYYSIFHSVSAFCNAGFSLFSNSLENYQNDLYMISVISLLIILGGLGFIVIMELYYRMRKIEKRLSLHSKLCLSVTGILLIGGTVLFMISEYNNAFGGQNFVNSLSNAFYQSVTCRTAGFNTIAQTGLTEVSLLLTMILMFIGACSGSTGGGIKTTTIGIFMLMAYNRFLGRNSTNLYKRSISEDSIKRATTIILIAVSIIVVMFLLLMFVQEKPLPHTLTHGWFIDNAFEVVSAFGTVGLSLGQTENLNPAGKTIIILLMFIGRVGLLTLVFSLAKTRKSGEIVYAEESVMVG